METIYDVGIPFFDAAKVTLVDNPSLPGVTKKNMWKGMIGFDRPTWIKSINKKTTVFLTGRNAAVSAVIAATAAARASSSSPSPCA